MLGRLLRRLRAARAAAAADGTPAHAAPVPPLPAPVPMVLYTRPGCHLCEEMKREIGRARLGRATELREVDIDGDPALVARFDLSIPVLEIAGRVAFKGRLDAAALARKLERIVREERL